MGKFVWPLILGVSRAPTITTQGQRVTPIAYTLGVRWPGGSYVTQFPIAVDVGEDDHTIRLPIVDTTRITIWLFQGITGLSIVLLAMVYLRRRKST